MPVDPWEGTYKGLASLNNTFDDLTKSLQWDEQQARQARRDALVEPLLRSQAEDAALSLEEKRRTIGNLRAYDAEVRNFEANPGTVPTKELLPNPNIVPGMQSLEGERDALNSPLPKVAPPMPDGTLAQPTMEVAGNRPLSPSEMNMKRAELAIKYGRYAELKNIGTIIDITDKIQNSDSKLLGWAKKVFEVRDQFGPEMAKRVGAQIAPQFGVAPEQVEGFDFGATGEIYKMVNGVPIIVDRKGGVHIIRPEKEPADKWGVATTAEGVITYDQRTGEPGRRLGSPKQDSTGGGEGGKVPIGKVNQVNRALVRRYLPVAQKNLEGKADAPKILEGINISLGSTDQFGGSVNDARLYASLSPSQRAGYDWVKAKAEEYAKDMTPEAAVDKAWQEGMAERKRQTEGAAKPAPVATAPAGYVPTGRQRNGKPLYHNPKAPENERYWTP